MSQTLPYACGSNPADLNCFYYDYISSAKSIVLFALVNVIQECLLHADPSFCLCLLGTSMTLTLKCANNHLMQQQQQKSEIYNGDHWRYMVRQLINLYQTRNSFSVRYRFFIL